MDNNYQIYTYSLKRSFFWYVDFLTKIHMAVTKLTKIVSGAKSLDITGVLASHFCQKNLRQKWDKNVTKILFATKIPNRLDCQTQGQIQLMAFHAGLLVFFFQSCHTPNPGGCSSGHQLRWLFYNRQRGFFVDPVY